MVIFPTYSSADIFKSSMSASAEIAAAVETILARVTFSFRFININFEDRIDKQTSYYHCSRSENIAALGGNTAARGGNTAEPTASSTWKFV